MTPMLSILLSEEERAYLVDLLNENLTALAEHDEPETVADQVTVAEMLLDKFNP